MKELRQFLFFQTGLSTKLEIRYEILEMLGRDNEDREKKVSSFRKTIFKDHTVAHCWFVGGCVR